ncbi:MAG: tetratricopeptide repeat protein [Candidatus Gastranaerophilales bacterium]|nr:tetratricopeptide repeat protein [Candidatus Gastranaerophilales bacterium]
MSELEKIQDLVAENSYGEAKKALLAYIADGHEEEIEIIKLMGLINVNLLLFADAAKDFEKALKFSPKDATALFYLANCYDNLGKLSDAERYYIKVLEVRENYIDAYKNLCIIYMKTGKEQQAIELAQKAKDIAPNDYTFDYLIGTASVTLKQYNKGIQHLEHALALNPQHFQIYNNLGTAYLLTGMRDKALTCYKKAIKIKPDDAVSYYNIGSIYQIQNQHAQACDYFSKAYQLDNQENYLVSLALSELKDGQIQNAAKHYKALALLHPEKDSFQYNLASCYELLRDFTSAISIMKKLVVRNPKSVSMAQKLANLYIEIRNFREAKELYDTVILKASPSSEVLYQYAILSTQLFDTGTAERIFKKVIKMEPDNAVAHKDLGVIYLNQRLFDYAEDEFRTAMKLAPENFDIIFEFANFLYSVSKYQEADEYYDKALSIKDDVVAKSLQAINKIELNELEEAKQLIEEALSEQPEHEYIQFLAGRIYYSLKHYDDAKIYFIKSLEQNPDKETKNLLALTYFELGEYEKALHIFDALLKENKKNISLMLSKAKCYEKMEEVDNALATLDELTEIFPECEEAHEIIRRIS